MLEATNVTHCAAIYDERPYQRATNSTDPPSVTAPHVRTVPPTVTEHPAHTPRFSPPPALILHLHNHAPSDAGYPVAHYAPHSATHRKVEPDNLLHHTILAARMSRRRPGAPRGQDPRQLAGPRITRSGDIANTPFTGDSLGGSSVPGQTAKVDDEDRLEQGETPEAAAANTLRCSPRRTDRSYVH